VVSFDDRGHTNPYDNVRNASYSGVQKDKNGETLLCKISLEMAVPEPTIVRGKIPAVLVGVF